MGVRLSDGADAPDGTDAPDGAEAQYEQLEIAPDRAAPPARVAAATAHRDGSTLCAALGELWGVAAAEHEAEHMAAHFERVLLSFAAMATLGPSERVAALLCTDTAARLRLARLGLEDQQKLLTDILLNTKERR